MLNLAMLTALGPSHELKLHVLIAPDGPGSARPTSTWSR
jgi:hypothetical protein